jgi:hypothetical protein
MEQLSSKNLFQLFVCNKLLRICLCFFLLAGGNLNAQTIYTTTGTSTYTVPSGVSKIKVECWGGGGGGASVTSSVSGGGGGGGAYSKSIVSVTAGNIYSVVVGSGGSAGNTGGSSTFNTSTVIAVGGSGVSSNTTTGASGGAASSCTGTIKYSGGAGGTSSTSNSGTSGGGGGGAGSAGIGGSAATATAGTGTTLYGGAGGSGLSNTNNNGIAGSTYGGGGSGATRKNGGSNYTGGTGAQGLVRITIPSTVILSDPSPVSTAIIYQGSTSQPIFSFATSVTTSDAQLDSVVFVTSGTYTSSQISNFKLWYSTSNSFSGATLLSTITASLGTGTHIFSGLALPVTNGTTGYFWISTDVSSSVTSTSTLAVSAFTATNLKFDLASVSGNTSVGGTQTITPVATIAITSSNLAVSAASVSQCTSDQIIYKFITAVTNSSATLNSVSFTTAGTCTSTDLTRFRLWYNTSNDFTTASIYGSEIISSLSAGTHTFSDLSIVTANGANGYFWITTDITSFPTNGHYLTVSAITTSNLVYSLGLETKSATTYAGGQMTVTTSSGIYLYSTNPAVSATSILQNTSKQKLYAFYTVATGSSATINSISFTTTGTCTSSDISNLKLWYSTTNSLVSASQIGSTLTYTGAGTYTFSGLSTATSSSATGYFWITMNVASGATSGRTIAVNALSTSNLTYSPSVTKSGAAFAGGTQTIAVFVDNDGDGVADEIDLDDDNDGIPDVVENSPCNTSLVEMFPNSSFSSGNTGFNTAYTYATGTGSLVPEGTYTVTSNPTSVHSSFASCGDHTSGSGNMMVINADPVANKIVWNSGTITVKPNTVYTLSFYMASVTSSNPAQLIWNVNNENIGNQFNAVSTNCTWTNAMTTWNSGNNTTANFSIVNLNTIASGNDFALDDISCTYRTDCDSDGDGIVDRLDLDSDNDGIYDVVEAGGTATSSGTISGFTDTDGDGLADAVDNVNSGLSTSEITSGTALTNADTDSDGSVNRIDLDSDGDGCYDVIEAGFTDGDNDGKLGTSTVTVNSKGVVTSATGYTTPADLDANGTKDYVQKVPSITTQPSDKYICLLSSTSTTFSVTASNSGGTYQWQVSTNAGSTWSNLSTSSVYSGVTLNTLTLSNLTSSYDNYRFRVLLTHPAYKCSPLISSTALLRAFSNVPSAPGTITGEDSICPSISSVYSISAMSTALSYTWTVPTGWTANSGAATSTLTATSASSAGSGTMKVTATNTCGTGTASTLTVYVLSPTPTFTTPSSTSACQSAEVTYTTQSGKSAYIWTVTGTQYSDYVITAGGSSTDNYITVKWYTTGSKSVSVNYTSGGCTGTTVTKTITVIANAIVSTQPVSPAAVCSGSGTVTMFITASGTVSTYLWQISTDGGTSWTDLTNTSPYSGTTTNTLTITYPLYSLNNAQYRCKVTGSCGAVYSNSAILTVNEATNISTSSISTQSVCAGTSFSALSVTAGGTGTLTYQWYSNNSASNSGGTAISGATSANYTPPSSTKGTKYYYCVVTGTCGTATSSASGAIITNEVPTTGPIYRNPNEK